MNRQPREAPLRLANENIAVEVDPAGAITQLVDLRTGWRAMDRAELARPVRLLVPLPDRRYNYIDVAQQAPPTVTRLECGLRFGWDELASEHGGPHPIGLGLTMVLHSDRLVVTTEIDNRSELTIENVHGPGLGAVNTPAPGGELYAFGHRPGSGGRTMLRPQFPNSMGFCSVWQPTFANVRANSLGAVGPPVVPFLLLENGRQGLYWGVDVPSAELLTWHGELHPGWRDSVDSVAPVGDTIDGQPVALLFEAVHVPFIGPGERRGLTPIALQFFTGDWHAGADIYKARREHWGLREAVAPAWACEPHAWQQLQLNSAEDTLHTPFAELPSVARECADRGVSVLQVTGWNDGGQDRNNPSHDPDPRLGGFDALKAAIKECQALGVRVVLFTKFIWADRSSERFRRELEPASIKDPYGDYYVFPGFRYDTITQLLDINTRRLIPMCFASPQWLDVCADEFATVTQLGADGMLHDEALHHSPALLCFDTSHGHRAGDPVYAHDRTFLDRLRAQVRDDDFLYAAEACYDWLFETYELSYHRSNTSDYIPLTRYLRPDAPIMTAVTGFEDRNQLNQCLLYRLIASYEPHFFKGRLTDFESTVGYGRAVDALRTELRDWLWDGTFTDTLGADVTDTITGRPHRHYAVYRAADGTLGVTIANYTDDPAHLAIDVPGAEHLQWRTVDEPAWSPLDGPIDLPARSAAVVVPLPSPTYAQTPSA